MEVRIICEGKARDKERNAQELVVELAVGNQQTA